jgi:HEAT repeat protein
MVLTQLTPHDNSKIKAVGESLPYINDKEVALLLLKILQQNPQEKSIKFILDIVEKGIVDPPEVYQLVAGAGNKAVPVLKKMFKSSSLPLQSAIVEILPRIKSESAMSFFIDQFFNENTELVRTAVHALREAMPEFNKKECSILNRKLKAAHNNKSITKNNTAFSAIIISMGITGDIKCKKMLLKHVNEETEPALRRQALKSLAALNYAAEGHGDLIKTLIPVLYEGNDEIVRLSVDVLEQIKPRKSDADNLIKIIENHKDSYVQSYAVRALGKLDTIEYAKLIIDLIWHKDRNLQKAAHETLLSMTSAGKAVLEKIDSDQTVEKLHDLIEILKHHNDKISKDKIKSMINKMYDNLEKNKARYTVYKNCVLAVDGEALQKSVLKKVTAAAKKKDYDAVRQNLQLLKGTEFMTDELRMQLAVAKLKTSRKDLNREFRHSDYSLSLIADMLKCNSKDFVREFLKQNLLGIDEYFYVGFHFMEKLHEERRFGAECLQFVVAKWGKTAIGKKAKSKLKDENIIK